MVMKKLAFLGLSFLFFATLNGVQAAVQEIDIEATRFLPSVVDINQGDTVRWINRSPQTYQIQGDFATSSALGADDRFEYVFNEAGNFDYINALNTAMSGTVRVAAVSEPAPETEETVNFEDLFGNGSGFEPDDLTTVNQPFESPAEPETQTVTTTPEPAVVENNAAAGTAPDPVTQNPNPVNETVTTRNFTPSPTTRSVTASAEQNLPTAGGDSGWLIAAVIFFLLTGWAVLGGAKR